MLSFLERNFQKCPRNVKEQLYFALVRPLVEYGCSAWDPYFDNQINKLELINKRAARFVTGNYLFEHGNTNNNMEILGWPPLVERRSKAKLAMLYKIKNNLIFVPHEHIRANYRKPDLFFIPHSGVESNLKSFFPSTIRLWNSLPSEVRTCSSFDSFKHSLEKITITQSYRN